MFSRPLTVSELSAPGHLLVQRLLQTSYEQDHVMLPRQGKFSRGEMNDFYADDYRVAGQIIRPVLERYAFGWLDNELGVMGSWTVESFKALAENTLTLSGIRMLHASWRTRTGPETPFASFSFSAQAISSRRHRRWRATCSAISVHIRASCSRF
ncbi:hypothetical protein BPMI_04741 [Candidatus Burkholderia pumila]|uniref:Uncharacterized protein n=1 Tax=Candidatus Burkholderia pumila TaxID=1090375 RepID=A0ABR5HME8_9BURK|nr:hypothetical protein BPMI_04741 [Candidatus Burkholderia pumila]